jgi:mRNA-degrading endonuclease YafQ of YafQ-DinJ toxin-antitoxin module
MTTIKQRIKEVQVQIKKKHKEIDILKKHIEMIQAECEHEKRFRSYDYTGDSNVVCEECGELDPHPYVEV